MEIETFEIIKYLKRGSAKLYSRFKQLQKVVHPIITRVYSAYPDLTEHDEPHLEAVLSILDLIIPKKELKKMSQDELFILSCSVWLHDIGLSLKATEFHDEVKRNEVREKHHIRGGEIICKRYKEFGLSEKEAKPIAEIVKAHRKTNILTQVSKQYIIGIGKTVRLQLLAALVMISDEFHITKDRTSELLIDLIEPRQESLVHHQLHQRIKGPVVERSLNTILFEAIPETETEMELIKKLEDKIQKKIDSVATIFEENNIPLRKIEVQFDQKKIYEKKTLLSLAKNTNMKIKKIAKDIGISMSDIKLIVNRFPYTITKIGSKLQLELSSQVFTKLCQIFLESEDEIEFVQSYYSKEAIEQFVWSKIEKKYGTYFKDPFDRNERIYILRNSPTALSFLVLEEKLHPPESAFSRKVLLDTSILFGGLVDVYRYPELLRDRELILCLRSVANQIPKQIVPYLDILQSLGQLTQVSSKELIEKMKPQREEEGNKELKVLFEIPRSPISEKYSIIHLWAASGATKQRVEIAPHYIKKLKYKTKSEEKILYSDEENWFGLTIIPDKTQTSLTELEAYARLENKYESKTIFFILSPKRPLGNFDFPYKISTKIHPSIDEMYRGRMMFSFPRQLFDSNEYFNFIKTTKDVIEGKLRRIKVIEEKKKTVFLEDLASEFFRVQSLPQKENIEVYNVLATLQRITGHRIPIYDLNDKQLQILRELYPKIKKISKQKANDVINKIRGDRKATYYRVTLFNNQNVWIKDRLYGPHWELISLKNSKFSFHDQEKKELFLETLNKRNNDFALQFFSSNTELEVWSKCLESFEEKIFLPEFLGKKTDKKFVPSSSIFIEFKKLTDRVFFKEQLIHININPVKRNMNKK